MKLNIKSFLILTSIISISGMGCLKDKEFDNGEIQSVHNTGGEIKPIEIKLTASSTSNFLTLSFDNSDAVSTVDLVPINLATAGAAPEDIQVTVALAPELVDAYNTDNGTSYVVPDPSMYAILNGGVATIKQGEHTGYVQISFKPSDFLGGSWALGFRITTIDKSGYVISGNMSTGITSLVIKNEFEADYSVTGYFVHPSAPRAIGQTKHIATVSAIRCEGTVGDLGSPFDFDVDGTDNLVNWQAQGATNPASNFIPSGTDNAYGNATYPGPPYVSTTYNNTYERAAQTFWMHYGYNGTFPAYSREIYEKWVRQ
jgi:hypothetical protein